jgi:MYXO-CTERM domain-containing protein
MSTTWNFKSVLRVAALASAGFVAAGAFSQAQALSLNVVGNKYATESIKFTGSTGTYYNQTMGAINVNDGTSSFWVYCIDPLTAYGTPNTYAVSSLYSYLNGGSYTAQFAQTGYTSKAANGYDDQNTAGILNKLVDLYSHAYNDSLTSNLKSAAFQYAVWEVMGESSLGGSSGGLRYNTSNVVGTTMPGTFRSQVDAYLSALSTGSWGSVWNSATGTVGNYLASAATFTYTVYTPTPTSGSQAFLKVSSSTSTNTGTPAPEPGTLALAAAALFGLGYTRRRQSSR